MDVFKIDLDQSQIRSSLVENSNNNSFPTGTAGNADADADDDEEEVIPEVSFDANSDFNLHFFDTPEDSSTQGGFSESGSIESETYVESPPTPTPPQPPAAAATSVQLASGVITESADSLHLLAECSPYYATAQTTLDSNCVQQQQQQQQQRKSSAVISGISGTSTAATLVGPINSINNLSCAAVVAASLSSSSSSSSSSSTSSIALGSNGGNTLYTNSSVHQFGQSHSSSSSGCSSTSSAGSCSNSSGGGGSNSIAIGNGRGGSTISSSSLGVEHCIGNNHNNNGNRSSSTSSSATSSTSTPLAHVKLQPDQQFAIAESNSNSVSKSFVPCKVCGDKASGYHYGVTSCEGCKGFFRRSIQKQIEYRCLRDGKCLVIRLNRNRCQYCRFKKCLSAGMSRDSVRYGRVPKRSRELNGTPSSTDDPNVIVRVSTPNTPQTPQMCSVASSPSDLGCNATNTTSNTPGGGVGQLAGDGGDTIQPGTATELPVYDVIMCVSQAHRMHCSYTEEQTRELMRRPISVPQNGIASSVSETMEFQKIWLWQQYAARVTPGVQRIVEFAKRVPGFCDFTQDDQLILIKLGFFEVWLSHVARMINDSTLTFDDGTYLTRQQLEILYDTDFVISLINFANTLNSYGLSDTEIGLYSAMVLLASDRSGISEHKVIARTRERVAEALRVQIVRSRPGSTQVLQLMPALEAKIPELRSLGAKHFSHLDWLRMNWTKLRLPPLFAEIFDIPKTEDDL